MLASMICFVNEEMTCATCWDGIVAPAAARATAPGVVPFRPHQPVIFGPKIIRWPWFRRLTAYRWVWEAPIMKGKWPQWPRVLFCSRVAPCRRRRRSDFTARRTQTRRPTTGTFRSTSAALAGHPLTRLPFSLCFSGAFQLVSSAARVPSHAAATAPGRIPARRPQRRRQLQPVLAGRRRRRRPFGPVPPPVRLVVQSVPVTRLTSPSNAITEMSKWIPTIANPDIENATTIDTLWSYH